MMSAPFRILTAEGDRWLQRATDTYTGGGDFAVAAAEASIASAYFARAAIEKPDTIAALLQAQQLAAAQQAQQAATKPASKGGRNNGAARSGARPTRGVAPAKRAPKQ